MLAYRERMVCLVVTGLKPFVLREAVDFGGLYRPCASMSRGLPDVPTTGSIDGKCRICKLRDNACVGPSGLGLPRGRREDTDSCR